MYADGVPKVRVHVVRKVVVHCVSMGGAHGVRMVIFPLFAIGQRACGVRRKRACAVIRWWAWCAGRGDAVCFRAYGAIGVRSCGSLGVHVVLVNVAHVLQRGVLGMC